MQTRAHLPAASTRPAPSADFVRRVPPDQLYRRAGISRLAFVTTADLQPPDEMVGQKRALQAIDFETRISKPGFNLFVIGPSGSRMKEEVRAVLLKEALTRPRPPDWIYVNNFKDADRPTAIELPAGRARKFAAAIHELMGDLITALPAVFQSED